MSGKTSNTSESSAAFIAINEKVLTFDTGKDTVIGTCTIDNATDSLSKLNLGNTYFYISKLPKDAKNSILSLIENEEHWFNPCKMSIPSSFHLLEFKLTREGKKEICIDYPATNENKIGFIEKNNENLPFLVNFSNKIDEEQKRCYQRGNARLPLIEKENKLAAYDYKRKEVIKDGRVILKGCGTACKDTVYFANNSKPVVFAQPKNEDKAISEDNIDAFYIAVLGKTSVKSSKIGEIIYRKISFDKKDELIKWLLISHPSKAGIAAPSEKGIFKGVVLGDSKTIIHFHDEAFDKGADTGLSVKKICRCEPVKEVTDQLFQ